MLSATVRQRDDGQMEDLRCDPHKTHSKTVGTSNSHRHIGEDKVDPSFRLLGRRGTKDQFVRGRDERAVQHSMGQVRRRLVDQIEGVLRVAVRLRFRRWEESKVRKEQRQTGVTVERSLGRVSETT